MKTTRAVTKQMTAGNMPKPTFAPVVIPLLTAPAVASCEVDESFACRASPENRLAQPASDAVASARLTALPKRSIGLISKRSEVDVINPS